MYVCMLTQVLRRTSLTFSVHVANGHSSVLSVGVAISYVLLVLWIASYFDIIGPMHILRIPKWSEGIKKVITRPTAAIAIEFCSTINAKSSPYWDEVFYL